MSVKSFLDTNLFIYAFSRISEEKEKREVCQKLIKSRDAVISSQVLQEFLNNALKKPKLGLGENVIDVVLQVAMDLRVVPVTRELVIKAVILRRRYKLSQWDATILAAALESGCSILYSEDFSHGQKFEGLVVVNPFR